MVPRPHSMVGVSAMNTGHLQASIGKPRNRLDAEFMGNPCISVSLTQSHLRSALQERTLEPVFSSMHLIINLGPLKS